MKCIFVMFDSLNRNIVGPYGGAVATPNLDRLAARACVFDNHYAGSLPCIPARREIHTGRLNFLHRGWGPLEPFDTSFAGEMRKAGVYSHLTTDHYHYFEDGGFGYHGRYDSYEFIRGQEKDKWRSAIEPGLEDYENRFDPAQRDTSLDPNAKTAYYASHRHLTRTKTFPLQQCFDAAVEFIDTHAAVDNWFLHVECFDPHEPFFLETDGQPEDADLLGGKIFDWPGYGRNSLDSERLSQLRERYEALVRRCDSELGRLLDSIDRNCLWDTTVVILTTDHGLLLGEKEFLGKNRPPFFNEVARIPLLIAAPQKLMPAPRRLPGLTQTTDLMPTFLDIFGIEIPDDIGGSSLLQCLAGQAEGAHEAVLFGQFGAALNFTDGRYSYFRYPLEEHRDEIYQYTLMPTHMRSFFEQLEFREAEVVDDLAYARGFPVWRLRMRPEAKANMVGRYPLLDAHDALYDLEADPFQTRVVSDPVIAKRCLAAIARLLREHQAPAEVFKRFGVEV
jgi:arylsulfatase A-like enzyme